MRISVPDRGVFPTLTLVTATAHQLNHDNTVSVWVKIYFGMFCPCMILQTDILPNVIVEEMCACDNILAGGDIQRSWSTASDQ